MNENYNDTNWQFSNTALAMKSSAIREILKITMQPDVISFAGGLPSPATFPVEEMRTAFDRVLTRHGKVALQYGPTDGYEPLRAWVADSLSDGDARILPDQVMMLSGSQQGLDLLGKVLLNPGDKVLVETPSYLGALQAFSNYGARFISNPSDENGLIPEPVRELGRDARLLYSLPNFQNPTGRTLSLPRRIELVDICARLGLPLIEDDPYGALSYKGDTLPRMLNMNPKGLIHLGSFSKILSPGIRLGYVVAPQALIRKMEQAKQATDLHTSQLTQMVVHEVIKDGFLERHIPGIRTLYADQCQAMLKALTDFMPSNTHWTTPQGGMFIWLTLPEGIDSEVLLPHAAANKVAFVPGTPFYADSPRRNTLRLSFVTVPEVKIREGISALARLIQ